jgi:hypothetical protein
MAARRPIIDIVMFSQAYAAVTAKQTVFYVTDMFTDQSGHQLVQVRHLIPVYHRSPHRANTYSGVDCRLKCASIQVHYALAI